MLKLSHRSRPHIKASELSSRNDSQARNIWRNAASTPASVCGLLGSRQCLYKDLQLPKVVRKSFFIFETRGLSNGFFSFGRTISLTKNCGKGMPLSMESIRDDFPLGGSYGSSLEFRG